MKGAVALKRVSGAHMLPRAELLMLNWPFAFTECTDSVLNLWPAVGRKGFLVSSSPRLVHITKPQYKLTTISGPAQGRLPPGELRSYVSKS